MITFSDIKKALKDLMATMRQTFTIVPNSTSKDYLNATSIRQSELEALSGDWAKVGQHLKQAITKASPQSREQIKPKPRKENREKKR